MNISWDDMRIFLAVARAESLSGAGRILKMDPATVGRRIGRLEDGVDTPLFTKSPQGYAMTGAGQRLLAHIERAEQALLEGQNAVQTGTPGQLSGQIRIGAPDGCASYLLPRVCAALAARNPDLELQIVALPRVFNLSRREADMAIGVSAPTAANLTVKKIADYHLHLAASRRYLKKSSDINTLDDLRHHRIVGYIPDMIFDKELDYLAEIGVGKVNLASNSITVQFNMLRQGAGVGFVHDFAVPSGPELKRVLTDRVSLTRSFYLIRHADDTKVERLNRVAEIIDRGVRAEITRLEAKLDSEAR